MEVSFDVSGVLYTLPEAQATLLAENLRGHAVGNFPKDDQLIARLGAAPGWSEGALAMADAIEDVLAGRSADSIGLDRGKGAGATYWVLRLMMDVQPDPKGAAGLQAALEELQHDYELDGHILAQLRAAREALAAGQSSDGTLTSAAMADLFKVRVEDVRDRLHHLALEGRVRESEARPDCWLIVLSGD
jgi:hypothetical protein